MKKFKEIKPDEVFYLIKDKQIYKCKYCNQVEAIVFQTKNNFWSTEWSILVYLGYIRENSELDSLICYESKKEAEKYLEVVSNTNQFKTTILKNNKFNTRIDKANIYAFYLEEVKKERKLMLKINPIKNNKMKQYLLKKERDVFSKVDEDIIITFKSNKLYQRESLLDYLSEAEIEKYFEEVDERQAEIKEKIKNIQKNIKKVLKQQEELKELIKDNSEEDLYVFNGGYFGGRNIGSKYFILGEKYTKKKIEETCKRNNLRSDILYIFYFEKVEEPKYIMKDWKTILKMADAHIMYAYVSLPLVRIRQNNLYTKKDIENIVNTDNIDINVYMKCFKQV